MAIFPSEQFGTSGPATAGPVGSSRRTVLRLGAYFARIGDKVLAVGIVSDSPADSAGLELFDEMLAIDGRPVSKLTRGDLDRLFTDGPEGATHTITVLRETKSMDIEVTLRDVI